MPQFVRLIAILSILSTLLSCSLFYPAHEPQTSGLESHYRFEPDSILDSLEQGKTDIFIPQEISDTVPDVSATFHWNQTDYLRIASAFSEAIWKEPVKNWNLHVMFFRLDCNDVEKGFEFASLEYFKVLDNRDKESRLRRSMLIDPSANLISIYETEYYPTYMDWSSIDLAKVKFSADDALEIAEKNGGSTVRLKAHNNCFITATLALDTFYEGWDVDYSLYGGNTSNVTRDLLNVYVDELTGQYEAVYPETK